MCKIDEANLKREGIESLHELDDVEVFPTFHVKGIRFNTKHFMFDIELTQLDRLKPVEPEDTDTIEEYCPSVEDLEETELDLEEESIYDIYDTLNEHIKEDMVENIRKLFLQKNLNLKLNLAEVVDDEEPETE